MPVPHRARRNYYSGQYDIYSGLWHTISSIHGLRHTWSPASKDSGHPYLRHSMVVFPVSTKGSRNFQIWYCVRGFTGPREPVSFGTLYAFLEWMFSVHCNVAMWIDQGGETSEGVIKDAPCAHV
jgi:hypothetical protein